MSQTMFFDAMSRGESFDYESYLTDVAGRGPLSAGPSQRRIPNSQGAFENPVYGDSELFPCHYSTQAFS